VKMRIRSAEMVLISLISCLPLAAQSLDGVWRSEGYGNVFVVKGADWKTFEVTSTTCVAGFSATRSTGATGDREATFRANEDFDTDSQEFFIRLNGSNDHKRLHLEGAASDIRMERISCMPAVCDHLTPDTPQDNFEVFTRTWAEQYISFDLKHVDWGKLVTANRPKVTAETSPIDLFAILAGMIQPFGDAHTSIDAPGIGMSFQGFRLGIKRSPQSVLKVTDSAYVTGPLRKFCLDQVQYGHIDTATGYLRILSFEGYSATGEFESDLAELENALDTIFSDPNLKALVIDVRINSGGADPLGLAIASRLATHEYLAYNKVARADPVDRNNWTPGDPSIVKPSTRPHFLGPVVELTGPSTVSAGETFTQALMGRTPHITRIGENTQGVFSDVFGRRLPNGWRFGLPNEVFLTPEGKAFDGPGIPPDIEIPLFSASDLATGKDPAMAKAIQVLAWARAKAR